MFPGPAGTVDCMGNYTKVNLKSDVEDHAPKFGLAPGLEFRTAREPLECEQSGFTYQRIAPDFRQPFGHKHNEQEEIYVVLAGGARVKLDDEIVELGPLDAVRIAPGVTRCVEAGPDGAEMLLYGAPKTAGQDAEVVPGWWTD
jgi:mannose-6-phosphate isomerase-like protein (cupin superfamily)